MSKLKHIQSLINEAKTYRRQGLLQESKDKYLEILDILKKDAQLSNKQSLIDAIIKELSVVENEIIELDRPDETPVLSKEIQNLISRLFSTSENKHIAALEGAVALAKFGQYEKALDEFQNLMKEGIRIEADSNLEQLSKNFNKLVKDLSDSFNNIREQSIQLVRYTEDLALSYKRIKEEEGLRRKMSRYVGQNLLEKLISSKDDTLFENERKEVTTLFADIRSFTALSERMTAEEVVSMLNEYFTSIVDVIFNNNGILDKFIGDELMAIFDHHTSDIHTPYYNAVKSALEIQNATEKLMKERAQNGQQTFDVGIGISTGDAIVGNIGSANRMDYTVIGDSVNTASRLTQAAHGGEILIGETTYNHVKDQFHIQKKGKIKLRNKKKPILYYKILR